jgi:formylglycine-generating enzyme required for sulfatase activity
MTASILTIRRLACAALVGVTCATLVSAQERSILPLPEAEAKAAKEMKPYAELIEHTEAKIDLVPIPGGKFLMGAPKDEEGSKDDERPQHEVEIAPFWMGKYEITWDAYEVWMFDLDIQRRNVLGGTETPRDKASLEYQLSQPTEPYTDMSFGMGKRGFPAICMTQLAAKTFCDWLSTKTGRYYRLPTEAEWEYACRAGTTTTYSFGDDAEQLGDYGWFFDNSSEKYQKVGKKKPNPWGLYDMHGNVSEWTLDQYSAADFYAKSKEQGVAKNPLNNPTKEYPISVRGGSWNDDPEILRSASRIASHPDWKKQDPQIPKSIWYFTDAQFVGFRIVRPLEEPTAQERKEKWDKAEPQWDRKKGRQ